MKEMTSPFGFEVVLKNECSVEEYFAAGRKFFSGDNTCCEPISVLDSRVPGGPTPSSTPSPSSTDTAGAAAGRKVSPRWQRGSAAATSSSGGGIESELFPAVPSLADKCVLEDWESVLSESAAASPGQEQSSFRWTMGDVEDPAVGALSKFLQFGGSAAAEFDFSGGFGVIDQAFGGENLGANFCSNFTNNTRSSSEFFDYASSNPIKVHQNLQNPMHPSSIGTNFGAISVHNPAAFDSPAETKPSVFINQHHAQNLSFFLPFPYAHEAAAAAPPPAKRLNSGGGQIRQQLYQQQQLQFLPNHLHHRPKTGRDELQQAIIEELFKAAELLQAGNPAPAQGILARLNQHLSPSGNPFHRAAFYCKEALQLLLHSTNPSSAAPPSPLSLLFKVSAYKSFSEISPLVDFANFTCNQAFLEAVGGFDRIHIVDFNIGYGGQWASLMQELALSNNGCAPLLKITALVSPSSHDQFELSLTRENLIQFANETSIRLELEFTTIDSLNSSSLPASTNEAVAVNIPASCLANHRLSAPSALKLVKQLSPKIIVSIERASDRRDLPLANHIIHGVEAYSTVLESMEAVNVDTLQKVERFLIQPEMEKLVAGRFGAPEKRQRWRSTLLNCGFSPVRLSPCAESQAELVVKRMGVEGFEVEKRQSCLNLCWRGKEMISLSAWK